MAAYNQARTKLEPQYAHSWTIASVLSNVPGYAIREQVMADLGSDYVLCYYAHCYVDEYSIRIADNAPEDAA